MKRLWSFFLVLICLISTSSFAFATERQQDEPPGAAEALALFSRMSPAERIGQLFLVSFEGSQITDNSPIYTLIRENHLGGVLLTADNDNFTDQGSTISDVRLLIDTLQEIAILGQSSNVITSTLSTEDGVGESLSDIPQQLLDPPLGVPLLIGTYHGGNGHSEIQTGLTPLPSSLALGATWSSDQVETVGEVAGAELTSLGVNLLLGPSLNILNNTPMVVSNEVGTNSFGGSPFWVGQLGEAYVRGVRSGSDGRLAVVATGFPGSGASDRSLTEEVATVRRSFDQLRSAELLPYLQVTGSDVRVDGLMTAHIRYQGFQGNIQANTPPVSFDPQALETLMSIPNLDLWQTEGGLLVSSPLGVPAMTRYYSPDGSEFPHRQVAKDAILAGNDLLVIDDFGDDTLANLQDTMSWFVERYDTDPAFKARVDSAVVKILGLKLRLYGGDLNINEVLARDEEQTAAVGRSEGPIYGAAQEAVTLLSPNLVELADRLPSAPSLEDQIVILTDVREKSQCTTCPTRFQVGKDTLAERMISLYGPNASGQVNEEQITSFDFIDLEQFLNSDFPIDLPEPEEDPTPTTPPDPDQTPDAAETVEPLEAPIGFRVQQALLEADWVIVALQDVTPGTTSAAFNRLLAERASLLRGKNVVVFAFELPIYLDTTEISQLTAYYGFFSSSEPFLDAAVQVVFRDLSPRGASPISVQSLDYDLESATRPRADQLIELFLFDLQNEPLTQEDEPLGLEPGDTLRLRTGVIVDQNGNSVPDGTVVRFTQEDRVSGFFDVIGEVLSEQGTATFDYVLEARPGQFRLRASAGAADTSEEVDIAIAENQEASVVVITPTPVPTLIPTISPTPTLTPTAVPEPTETPTPEPAVEPEPEPQLNILLSELQMLFSMVSGIGILTFISYWSSQSLSERVRRWLWACVVGLIGYIYFILELPPLVNWLPDWGNWLGLMVILIFGLIGLAAAQMWQESS
ncbi:MAG: glycoside hydrolase family 3 N-terminal domain-containing protein [Ardenticatenaceae bacterium]|nr:glycoside hydrolase family 3 N-terminal domain-containing protein [Ardenticatenaceae bacterium]